MIETGAAPELAILMAEGVRLTDIVSGAEGSGMKGRVRSVERAAQQAAEAAGAAARPVEGGE